jgi:hypothetical protein
LIWNFKEASTFSRSELVRSEEIVVRIERHRVWQWQFSLHPTIRLYASQNNIVVPLQRQKVRNIDFLCHTSSPNVNPTLDGQTLDDSDRTIAPEPRDVHLVETLDQRSAAAQGRFAIFVLRVAGVVDVNDGGGEGGVDAGDGDVALVLR